MEFDAYFVSLALQQATHLYVSSNLANPKLMNNTMASIKIRIPNKELQIRISKVFKTIDTGISLYEQTMRNFIKQKQYLLCQMFI